MKTTLLVLTGGVLILVLLWSGDRGARATPSNGAARKSDEFHETGALERTGAESRTQTGKSDPMEKLADWQKCFLLSGTEFEACFVKSAPAELSPSQVAWVLALLGPEDSKSQFVLRHSLLHMAPELALSYADSVCVEFGDTHALQVPLEELIVGLLRDQSTWATQTAATITPQALFGWSSTEGPVIIAAALRTANPEIGKMLEAGARGEWGGSDMQIGMSMGYAVSVYSRSNDADGALEFLRSVLDSPARSNTTFCCQRLVSFLTFRQFFPNGNSRLNCDYIMEMLTEPQLRATAARQLWSLYGERSPDGVPEADWDRIRQEIELALGT